MAQAEAAGRRQAEILAQQLRQVQVTNEELHRQRESAHKEMALLREEIRERVCEVCEESGRQLLDSRHQLAAKDADLDKLQGEVKDAGEQYARVLQ